MSAADDDELMALQREANATRHRRQVTDMHLSTLEHRLIDALADCVVKATEFGEQDGGFVASYILPTGPLHRAIPLLQEVGITVRPGFDGRKPS